MAKKGIIITGIIIIIGALIFSGCAKTEAPAPSSPTTPTPAPSEKIPTEILLGDVACYTGGAATFGVNAFGTEAAVEDINNEGGIYIKEYDKKLPVRWICLDNQSDPNKVAPLTEDLILKEKVHFIGPHNETPPFAVGRAVMCEKYKIAGLVGTGPIETTMAMEEAAGGCPHAYWYGMSIGTPPSPPHPDAENLGILAGPTYMNGLADMAKGTNKKVALFASDDVDGRSWYIANAGLLKEQGYECYNADKQFGLFPLGTTDFTPIVTEWKKAGCDLLLGNSPATEAGTMWKQCHTLGFQPKVAIMGRAANFYTDISSWGEGMAEGICFELFWTDKVPGVGIGGTTAASLFQRFYDKTGLPMAQGIGYDYAGAQALFDAIERAGTLNSDDLIKALGETDMMTMDGRWVFDKETRFRSFPVSMGQWHRTDNPWVWEPKVIFSHSDFLKKEADLIPIPYD